MKLTGYEDSAKINSMWQTTINGNNNTFSTMAYLVSNIIIAKLKKKINIKIVTSLDFQVIDSSYAQA